MRKAFVAAALVALWSAQSFAQAPAPEVSVTAPDRIEQGTRFEVTYAGPVEKGDQVQIAWPRSANADFIASVLVTTDRKPRRMTAPGELGIYEVRYFSVARNAVIARKYMEVVGVSVSIEAPEQVGQGTKFEIVWQGPAAPEDRIEIARSGFLQSDVAVGAVEMRRDHRPVVLEAPIETGSYELRYVSGGDNSIAATRPIRVVAVDISVEAPDDVLAGGRFEVRWRGPAAEFDQIRLARTGAPDTDYIQAAPVWTPERPVTLTAPLEPGRYRLGYWSARAQELLEEVTIDVAAEVAEATLEAPREVDGGGRLTVAWTGPGAPFDEIEIARPEMAPGEHVASALVPDIGRAAMLDAPVAPGVYELRYWSGSGRAVLASRQLIVAIPVVSLAVTSRVAVNAPFMVDWRGPAGKGDEIRVAPLGARPDEAIHRVLLEAPGEPARLIAPAQAGTYQLRYWSGRARAVLASVILTVE